MITSLVALQEQKQGNTRRELEDAYACMPRGTGPITSEAFTIAVCDGASQTAFAAEWAKLLSRAYVRSPAGSSSSLATLASSLHTRWHSIAFRSDLPWYAHEKAGQGSFATLLGLRIQTQSAGPGFTWSATAIGDTCLFHTRANTLLKAFPIEDADEFTQTPALLSSLPSMNHALPEAQTAVSSICLSRDVFLLATDALARWILQSAAAHEEPLPLLLGLLSAQSPQQGFAEFLADLRQDRTIKNDDVTCIAISVQET